MRNAMRWFLLVFLISAVGVCYGQNTDSGDITGTVTDATGAVIPGVTVTVKDVTKGVVHTFVTNGAGVYVTTPIVPDTYLVTFTKEGFQTYVRGPITISVGTTQLNVKMNVGASSQRVVVTTNVPLLDTADGTLSDTLQSKTMEKLPQTGQPADWENFIWLQPGRPARRKTPAPRISPMPARFRSTATCLLKPCCRTARRPPCR